MKDKEFDRIMDKWASHEVTSAPELGPTKEVYNMVESLRHKTKFSNYARLVLVGVAAVCLLLFVSMYPLVFRPVNDRSSIALRQGVDLGKGDSPDIGERRGQKKGPDFFANLSFIHQKQDSQSLEFINILQPQEDGLILTPDDSYKLSIQTVDDGYIYIFQLDPGGVLAKLVPNDNYGNIQNPLLKGRTYVIPSRSNWFYLNGKNGKERIYIIASAQPMANLESLYAQYEACKDHLGRLELLSLLLREFEASKDKSGLGRILWEFTFGRG